jgi:hypothetical protein
MDVVTSMHDRHMASDIDLIEQCDRTTGKVTITRRDGQWKAHVRFIDDSGAAETFDDELHRGIHRLLLLLELFAEHAICGHDHYSHGHCAIISCRNYYMKRRSPWASTGT